MNLKQRNVFEVVRIVKGMKLMGMTMSNEYKVVKTAYSQGARADNGHQHHQAAPPGPI
jgi:hypothetical protein